MESCTLGINSCKDVCGRRDFSGRFYRFRIAGMYVKHKMPCEKYGGRECCAAWQAVFQRHYLNCFAAVFRYARTVACTERREHISSQTEMSG